MLGSLLPQTTRPAPLLAINSAAVFLIPSASALGTFADVPPPNAPNNAKATAPVSDGLCKYLSSALAPVILK